MLFAFSSGRGGIAEWRHACNLQSDGHFVCGVVYREARQESRDARLQNWNSQHMHEVRFPREMSSAGKSQMHSHLPIGLSYHATTISRI